MKPLDAVRAATDLIALAEGRPIHVANLVASLRRAAHADAAAIAGAAQSVLALRGLPATDRPGHVVVPA